MTYPILSREWIEALRVKADAERFYPCQTCGKIKAVCSDWDCDRCYRLEKQKRGRATPQEKSD